MNAETALGAVSAALADIAPEADLATVEPDVPLRTELDLDSLDFLSLIESLRNRTGVDIPERDYPKVDTLDHLVGYLEAHAA